MEKVEQEEEKQGKEIVFKKIIKIDDFLGNEEDNILMILESPNMQIGTGSRI